MTAWTDWLMPAVFPAVVIVIAAVVLWLYRRIKYRQEREYLISAFAKHSGISETEMRRIMNDKSKPGPAA